MSDSLDTANELDSYGVWVKNTSNNNNDDDFIQADNFTDSLDLSEFENIEEPKKEENFDDMFNDSSLDIESETFDNATLSTDELNNITKDFPLSDTELTMDDFSVDTNTEIPVPDINDFNFDTDTNTPSESDSIDIPDFDIPSDSPIQEPSFNSISEPSIEEPAFEETSFDSITEPSMDIPSFDIENTSTETPAASEEVEENISLDDFMEGGFSDESVASGNNGFEQGKGPESTEEVSLDDFIDVDSFETDIPSQSKEDTIVDEKPLEMDISFDPSADTIETETNTSIESEYDEEEYLSDTKTEEDIEEFHGSTEITNSDETTEEIDLSDFGIDANAEETPIVQDVESQKVKEEIVDFDLQVGGDNTSAAPIVNELKNEIPEAEELLEEEIENISPLASAAPVDSGILQQIVDELSNLKNEINTLKTNLSEIKSKEPEISFDDNDIIEDKEDNGFFSGIDDDDTIALSTDELSNIMTTANINSDDETIVEENPLAEFDTTNVETDIIDEDLPNEISIPTDNFESVDGIPSFDESENTDANIEEEKFDDVFDSIPEPEEPTFDETEVEIDDSFDSVENTIEENISNDYLTREENNNKISESNIDYLTKEPVEEDSNNTDLKKDIKSVLLYMDQLLENLPDDKIEEFAKSNEFNTYKKLFSELGLS